MGRSEQEDLTASQIFYPCMQCADIFFLQVQFTISLCDLRPTLTTLTYILHTLLASH